MGFFAFQGGVFSSEVDTGSREENAINKRIGHVR